MSSTEPNQRERRRGTLSSAVSGGLVALIALVVFVTIAVFPTGRPDPAGATIDGPTDWYNLVRLAVAAFVVCAAGVFVYRRTSSRALVMALALGLTFIGLDSLAVIDQVASQAGKLPPQELVNELRVERQNHWSGISPQRRETMEKAAGALIAGIMELASHRRRLYCAYHVSYVFWAVLILYAGYLGQYAVGRLVRPGAPARRESSLYVAENAGIDLAAGLAAGVLAIALASAMAACSGGGASFVRDIGMPEMTARANAAAHTDAREQPAAPAAENVEALRSGNAVAPTRLKRLRVYVLLVVTCFFVAGYVMAVAVRPRTSTWIVCGAIVGVMLLGAIGVLFAGNAERFGMTFRLLELSPFTLSGVAVAATLFGDWTGRQLVGRTAVQQNIGAMRPL